MPALRALKATGSTKMGDLVSGPLHSALNRKSKKWPLRCHVRARQPLTTDTEQIIGVRSGEQKEKAQYDVAFRELPSRFLTLSTLCAPQVIERTIGREAMFVPGEL